MKKYRYSTESLSSIVAQPDTLFCELPDFAHPDRFPVDAAG